MVRDAARDFAQNRVLPLLEDVEFSGDFPETLTREMGELGFLGICAPEAYGGADLGTLSYVLVTEEITRVSTSLSMTVGMHNSLYQPPILKFGNEEQKQKYVTPTSSGEKYGTFCLTEPGNGSDAAAANTTAVRDGDDWIINGRKMWITNGAVADYFLVFCQTDPSLGHKGMVGIMVDKGTPGLTVGKNEKKMGIWGSPTNEVIFDNARVPAANLLGNIGDGFKIAMVTIDGGRIGVAAQALGIMQAAMDHAARYSSERETFGKPLHRHQMIQSHLADMAVMLETARAMTYRAAWMKEQGLEHNKHAAIAKLYATECATKVTHKAVQIFGGYGYSREYPVERLYRDCRVMEIYEGTSEIQRIVIAKALVKEYELE